MDDEGSHDLFSGFGDSSSVILFGSFQATATYFVWLPRATSSSLPFVNLIEVYARVLPTVHNQHTLCRFL